MKIKKIVSLMATCFFMLSVITVLPVKAVENTADDIKGNLVIVGGALEASNADVYNEFIELAGGTENAKIGIIPAASSKPSKYGETFKNDLINYGMDEQNIVLIPIAVRNDKTTEDIDESTWIDNVNKDEIKELIESCTGIWFVGGDQYRLTSALYNEDGSNTKALDAVWEIYKDGAVLGGTSAGAAIMSDPMLLDGDSLGALKEAKVGDENSDNLEYQAMDLVTGLGFFKYGLVDQHFDQRARYGRLIMALSQTDEFNIGYGIDENTAMVVNNFDKSATVVGKGGVTLFDLSKAVRNENPNGVDMNNIFVSHFCKGDKVDLTNAEITPSDSKYDTKGYEYYDFEVLPATGVLTGRGTFVNYLAYNLLDNERAEAVKSYIYDNNGDGFELIFREVEESNGYWGYMDGNKDSYTLIKVALDIKPMTIEFREDVNMDNVEKKKNIKGNLLIVGGALGTSNKAVYEKFIDLAGGTEKAKIGIIPAASSKLSSSNGFKDDLINYGLKEENIVILPISGHDFKKTDEDESTWLSNSNNDEIAKQIEKLTGIWMVGGDQTRITQALLNEEGTNSKALDALWNVYEKGGVIAGTSAGAAVMSDIMLAGGASYGALSKGFTDVFEDESDQEAGPVCLERGLGFFDYGIIDQHFDGKARLARLIVTAVEKGKLEQNAYGIDEDTAMLFNNDGMLVEVVGRGGVTVIDLENVSKDNTIRTSLNDAKISFLKPGDKYNIETKEFIMNPDKYETTGGDEYYEYTPQAVTGVFSEHGLWKDAVSYALVDNYENNQIISYAFDESGNGFKLLFNEKEDTKGYWNYSDGNKDDYSFTNVYLDIIPVKVNIQNNGVELVVEPEKELETEPETELEYTIYVVKAGDCLADIASEFGVDIMDIVNQNNIANPSLIFPGQEIKIFNAK